MSKGRIKHIASRISATPSRKVAVINPNGWDKTTFSHSKTYGSYRWQQTRVRFLALYPLCAHCQAKNIVTVATVVDHIEPHRGNMALFWDESNFQPLCETCHNRKTATEDSGFGNVRKP